MWWVAFAFIAGDERACDSGRAGRARPLNWSARPRTRGGWSTKSVPACGGPIEDSKGRLAFHPDQPSARRVYPPADLPTRKSGARWSPTRKGGGRSDIEMHRETLSPIVTGTIPVRGLSLRSNPSRLALAVTRTGRDSHAGDSPEAVRRAGRAGDPGDPGTRAQSGRRGNPGEGLRDQPRRDAHAQGRVGRDRRRQRDRVRRRGQVLPRRGVRPGDEGGGADGWAGTDDQRQLRRVHPRPGPPSRGHSVDP